MLSTAHRVLHTSIHCRDKRRRVCFSRFPIVTIRANAFRILFYLIRTNQFRSFHDDSSLCVCYRFCVSNRLMMLPWPFWIFIWFRCLGKEKHIINRNTSYLMKLSIDLHWCAVPCSPDAQRSQSMLHVIIIKHLLHRIIARMMWWFDDVWACVCVCTTKTNKPFELRSNQFNRSYIFETNNNE